MQNLVFGIISGSIIALASVGFSMVRQTENFLNIAHGQLLAVGAFLGVVVLDSTGLNIFASGLISMVLVGALGTVLALVFFDPIRDRGATVLLFTSIGLALVIYSSMIMIFGTQIRLYEVSFGGVHHILGIEISTGELIIVGLAISMAVLLQVFLRFTRLGRYVRAVASNAELARVRGVSSRTVSGTVWFISSALAGLAGVMLGALGSVNVELGWNTILIVLAAAVLGGLGSIYGVLAAGLLLGIVMDLSALVIPTSYRTVVAFGVLILVLLIRPQGLFARATCREQVA